MSDKSVRRHPQADEIVKTQGLQALSANDAIPYTSPEPEPEVQLFDSTDLGNGRRLAHWFGKDLRYSKSLGRWFIWTGQVFVPDVTDAIRAFAHEAAERIGREIELLDARVQAEPDAKRREELQTDLKALRKCATRARSTTALNAMLREASSLEGIAVHVDDLDADPMIIATANGVIDLATGKLRAADRDDLLTRQLRVPYQPRAACPAWTATLHRVFGGCAETVAWFQKACGYALSGETSEQVLFLLYGTGANGKSTVMEALMDVLAPFAVPAPPGLLLQHRFEPHPTSFADLRGARAVIAAEAEQDRSFDEAVVKRLTGSDRIKARYMRQDFFDFRPTHKIFLMVNHLPNVEGTDHGIKRRLVVVPFTVTIPEAERDRQLPEKLRLEAPGILAWLVQGCVRWRAEGLGRCPAVIEATLAYDEETNVVGQFLTACTQRTQGVHTAKRQVFDAYREWCGSVGLTSWSDRVFSRRCVDHGLVEHRTSEARMWRDLQLVRPVR